MQSFVIVFRVKFIVSILPLIMFDLGIVLGVKRVLMCINLQQCLFILSWLCSWSDLKIQLPAHYSTQTHNVQLARHSVLSPLHISSDWLIVWLLAVKPGVRYREMGNIIQKHAQAHGYSVVRSYCGHGIHQWVSTPGLSLLYIYCCCDNPKHLLHM